MTAAEIVLEIDTQIERLHRCRSVFPRLGRHLAGQKTFEAPAYYRQLGFDVVVALQQPMTEEFIDTLNNLAHWLNENFILRLYAVLESNSMYRSKLDQNLPGYDEMDIVRRLRNMIGHGSEYDPADSGKKKLYDRVVAHFNVQSESYLQDAEKYPIAVGQVLVPMAHGCKVYVQAKLAPQATA